MAYIKGMTRLDYLKTTVPEWQAKGKKSEEAFQLANTEYFKSSGNVEHHVFKNIPAKKKEYTVADVKTMCTAAGIEYEEGDELKIIEFVASDETADREGDVMRMDGGDFTDFKTNPQFLYVHDYHGITIGSVLKLVVDKSDSSNPKLVITVLFQTVTDEAADLFELTRRGFMKAVSIGFRAKEGGIHFPTEAEREAMGMRPGGVIFMAWELYEVSLCPIGMNAHALKKSFLHKKTIDMLTKQNVTILSDKEELDMKPEEVKSLILEAFAGIGKQFEDVALFSAKIKSGEEFTADHVIALHAAHKCMSKAVTHLGKIMKDHPTVPEAGDDGEEFTEENSKSLGHAMDNTAKALVHMKMIGATHIGDEQDDGSEDDEGKALLKLAGSFSKSTGGKSDLELLNETFTPGKK